MKFKRLPNLLQVSCFLFLLSCQTLPQPSLTEFKGNAMTINYRILIGNSLSTEQHHVITSIIHDTFREVDTIYNKWNPNSEISFLNRSKANIKISISPKLERLLLLVDRVVALTEGRFDPTVEPLHTLWKKNLQLNQIPSRTEIDALIPAVGWNKIHVENSVFYKEHDLTEIDLSGIAKGYCVDLLLENIAAAGFSNIYVEWGGEIRTTGQHPDHRPWTIYISHLKDSDPEHALCVLKLTNQAIATSGDYIQNWTVSSGEKLTHVINPKTYEPLKITEDSIASATVVAPTCALADGLATAAMLFSNDNELQVWINHLKEKNQDVNLWIIKNKY